MSALLLFYRTRLRISLALQMQYRVGMAIWMLWLVLEPVVYLSVWTAVAQSSGGSVGGFTPGDFAAYYIVLLVVSHFTQIWHMWEYDYIIRQGILSGRLLRPLHPIHNDAAENIAYKLLMLFVVLPVVAGLVLAFRPILEPPLWAVLAFLPAVLLAAVLAFLAGWALAMVAFWTQRIFAVNQAYYIAMLFFAGQIAPLELLPQAMQTAAGLLPFRWFVAFPVELLLGRLGPEEVLGGFVAQGLWIALMALLVRAAWKAGVRQYSAVGG